MLNQLQLRRVGVFKRVLCNSAVKGSFCAEVVDFVMVFMNLIQKLYYIVYVVSVHAFKSLCWKAHSNDVWVDICKVQVETILLVSPFVPTDSFFYNRSHFSVIIGYNRVIMYYYYYYCYYFHYYSIVEVTFIIQWFNHYLYKIKLTLDSRRFILLSTSSMSLLN